MSIQSIMSIESENVSTRSSLRLRIKSEHEAELSSLKIAETKRFKNSIFNSNAKWMFNNLIQTKKPFKFEYVRNEDGLGYREKCRVVKIAYTVYIVKNTLTLINTVTSVQDPTHQYYNVVKTHPVASAMSIDQLLSEVSDEISCY